MGIFDAVKKRKISHLLKNHKITAVVDMGKDISPLLISLLDSNDVEIKKNALEVIGLLRLAEAFDKVCESLNDGELTIAAIKALSRLGNPRAIDNLNLYLNSYDPNIKKEAKNACLKLDKMAFARAKWDDIIKDEEKRKQSKSNQHQNKGETSLVDSTSTFTPEKTFTKDADKEKQPTLAQDDKSFAKESDDAEKRKKEMRFAKPQSAKSWGKSRNRQFSRFRRHLQGTGAVDSIKSSIHNPQKEVPGEFTTTSSRFARKHIRDQKHKIKMYLDREHNTPDTIYGKINSFFVQAQTMGCKIVPKIPTSGDLIDVIDILIIGCPKKQYTAPELARIKSFVKSGGGLLLLGSWGGMKCADCLNQIINPFGISFNADLVVRYAKQGEKYQPVFEMNVEWLTDHILLNNVKTLQITKSCSINPGKGQIVAYEGKYSFSDKNFDLKADSNEERGLLPVVISYTYENGRILCIGDYLLLSRDDQNHKVFMDNVITWLAEI